MSVWSVLRNHTDDLRAFYQVPFTISVDPFGRDPLIGNGARLRVDGLTHSEDVLRILFECGTDHQDVRTGITEYACRASIPDPTTNDNG
jgi:hypothetical protein